MQLVKKILDWNREKKKFVPKCNSCASPPPPMGEMTQLGTYMSRYTVQYEPTLCLSTYCSYVYTNYQFKRTQAGVLPPVDHIIIHMMILSCSMCMYSAIVGCLSNVGMSIYLIQQLFACMAAFVPIEGRV